MHTLEQVASRPSAWDSPSNYLGTPLNEFRNQYVVLCRNRDSDLLTNHNFETALSMLGGESEDVQINRFNHWACGWWEALTVTQKKQAEGQAIVDKLEQHPVLNEDTFSEKEWNAAQDYWANLSIRARVQLCQEAEISVFAARHDYIPQEDNGYIFEHCRPD